MIDDAMNDDAMNDDAMNDDAMIDSAAYRATHRKSGLTRRGEAIAGLIRPEREIGSFSGTGLNFDKTG